MKHGLLSKETKVNQIFTVDCIMRIGLCFIHLISTKWKGHFRDFMQIVYDEPLIFRIYFDLLEPLV